MGSPQSAKAIPEGMAFSTLVVTQSGFEPETYCLEGSCSIQLSYWAIIFLLSPFKLNLNTLEAVASRLQTSALNYRADNR